MKVENMTSTRGNKIPNQFIITDYQEGNKIEYFQSYDVIIAKKVYDNMNFGIAEIFIDQNYWDYSRTTGKYRNIFLGEGIRLTRNKLENNQYILTDLN